jgi:hypothetical protein
MSMKNSVTLAGRLLSAPTLTRLRDGTGHMARARVQFWAPNEKPGYISLVTFDPSVANKFRGLTRGRWVEFRGELDFSEWNDPKHGHRSEVQLHVLDLEVPGRPATAARTVRAPIPAAG